MDMRPKAWIYIAIITIYSTPCLAQLNSVDMKNQPYGNQETPLDPAAIQKLMENGGLSHYSRTQSGRGPSSPDEAQLMELLKEVQKIKGQMQERNDALEQLMKEP